MTLLDKLWLKGYVTGARDIRANKGLYGSPEMLRHMVGVHIAGWAGRLLPEPQTLGPFTLGCLAAYMDAFGGGRL